MKNKTIITDKATLLLVETENIDKNEDGYWLPNNEGGYMHIPFDQYQLTGRLTDITEEQASDLFEKDEEFDMYQHYKDTVAFMFAKQALHSLLQANEVYFENPVKLPNYDMKYMTSRWTYYGADILKHREAQSKVWDKERTYLFIKVD